MAVENINKYLNVNEAIHKSDLPLGLVVNVLINIHLFTAVLPQKKHQINLNIS